MKNIYTLCLLFVVKVSFSQALAFRDFMIAASSSTNPKIMVDGFRPYGGKDRFVSDNWLRGGIYSTAGEFVSEGYKFNYDYMDNEVFLKSDKDDQIINLVNSTIKRFFLIDEKTLDTVRFVKYVGIDPRNKQFYELIGGEHTENAGLLKFKTVEKIKADKTSYLNNFNGTYQDSYKEILKYYFISKPKGIIPLDRLLRKTFTDAFPDLKEQANLLVKKPSLNEEQAKDLLNFLNSPSAKAQ